MSRAVMVAPAAEFGPGEVRVVNAGNLEIGVFNVDGTYYALPNLCVHQWGPLCEGKVTGTFISDANTGWEKEWTREDRVVVCPWHSLEFDIETGQCLAYPKVKLRRYSTSVEDGTVLVHV